MHRCALWVIVVCFNDYHCLYSTNTFKIDGSTMRTYSNEFLAALRPKTHWRSLLITMMHTNRTMKGSLNKFLLVATSKIKIISATDEWKTIPFTWVSFYILKANDLTGHEYLCCPLYKARRKGEPQIAHISLAWLTQCQVCAPHSYKQYWCRPLFSLECQ